MNRTRDGEPAPVIVDLFSAADCSLCRVALADLAPLAKELGLVVHMVDIAGDPRLEARYRSRIPVAEIRGHTVFKYELDEARLREMVARVRGSGG
ncbi:MAG: glutaredoxin family protein [Actinobacteria bacterium]|nr:glutaredoxin family protein [Actinomycetota bacterium]